MNFDIFNLHKPNLNNWPSEIKVFTDGACRNNPGQSSFGLAFYNISDELILEVGHRLGEMTNNQAEYKGIAAALKLCCEIEAIKCVQLFSDSEFAIKQLKGEYKIKNTKIKPLATECFKLIEQLDKVTLFHVHREKNTLADSLANQALDL